MKKLFFFKSSSSNGSDKQIQSESSPKGLSMKSGSEEPGGQALGRSRSLSSAAFLVDGQRNPSSRCFTPERHMYTSCSSSQVLDRYIDGEEHLERSKQKSNRIKGKRFPPRVQCQDLSYTDLRDASPPSLAKSVIERLSHTHGYDPIRIQDVYGKTLDSNSHVFANLTEHYKPVANSELEKKYKKAEKRVKLLSEQVKEHKLFSERDFDTSTLVKQMEEERVGLAFEVVSLLRSQMVEREEMRRAKMDWDLHLRRLEKEKSELQDGLEKEIDTRSSEWTSKLQMEEKRLRERVRELAEQNVSLQRRVSTFHEKETQRIDMIRHLDDTVTELSATAEELREENSYLVQNLSKLQKSYDGTREDLDCVRRNFEEKDMECRELHKSVTKFLRSFKEQEKTIQGLRDGLSKEMKKQPSEQVEKKLHMEQIRLTGVELSLRKELESVKLEAESFHRENICLLNRVKGNGDITTTLKLDNEMKMRVGHLQDQGISMLNESTQLCYKFLNFIKDTQSMKNGLSEQFLVESGMRVHGIRRRTENLKRSLQTVTSLLLEKSNEMASNSESSSPSACNNQSVEKRCSRVYCERNCIPRKKKSNRLQAQVTAGVRGNEVLQCQVRNTLDKLSINTHQLKDLKLQKENLNRLEINLQEAAKDLEEREQIWKDVRERRERNVDLESDKEMMKKKIEKLEEDLLFKEGQITILKDTLGSKHFGLLSTPHFSYDDFLVQ